MKGKLIALEGPDGCGKSTHARLLGEWLQSKGYEVRLTDEPTDNPVGRIVKRAIKEEITLTLEAEALLFACDRAIHVAEDIKPAMKEGKIVITERYLHSSLAYQTVRGLSVEWIEAINKSAIKPDLVILIDVPAEIGLERIGSKQRDSFERDLKLQRKVRESYRKLAEEGKMEIVYGTMKINQTQSKIRKMVGKILHTDS